MNKRDAALLADRQKRVVDDLIAKAKRILKEIRVRESRGNERLGNLLSIVEKAQGFSPTADQSERLWSMVAEGQRLVEELMPMVRIRYSDEAAEELDSKSMGLGYEM